LFSFVSINGTLDIKGILQIPHEWGEPVNCWDFMKCGYDEGSAREDDTRSCPAYPHYGKSCASVAGTLCGGLVQGTFAMKIFDCVNCDFYNSEHYDKTKLESQATVACNLNN
jgi:hypothetical protein